MSVRVALWRTGTALRRNAYARLSQGSWWNGVEAFITANAVHTYSKDITEYNQL